MTYFPLKKFANLALIISALLMTGCLNQYHFTYTPFVETHLDVGKDIVATKPIDEIDKKILPDILNQYEYHYKIKNNEIYIEPKLANDLDMMEKISDVLHEKQGKKRQGFSENF